MYTKLYMLLSKHEQIKCRGGFVLAVVNMRQCLQGDLISSVKLSDQCLGEKSFGKQYKPSSGGSEAKHYMCVSRSQRLRCHPVAARRWVFIFSIFLLLDFWRSQFFRCAIHINNCRTLNAKTGFKLFIDIKDFCLIINNDGVKGLFPPRQFCTSVVWF